MKEVALRNYWGMSIFFGQCALTLLVLFSPFYGVTFADAMSLLTVVAPLLGGHAVVVLRYFAAQRYSTKATGRQLSFLFVFLSWFILAGFFLVTVAVFLCYALDLWNVSLEETRFAITSLEAVFSVYLGIVVSAVFGTPEKRVLR